MSQFQVHTTDSAPAGARPILDGAQKSMGFVPNLFGVFAESPELLKAYTTIGSLVDATSFTPTERQIVLLATSFDNECDYCMAAHSTIAGMQNVAEDVVGALRSGDPIADPKLEALRTFTQKVVHQRGRVADVDVQAFVDAGYARKQVLEVVLGVGMKTLSNYTNHLADTPLDDAFQPKAWTAPERVSAN